MRILIVSTPRSGNTWFRRLLSGALDLPDFAVHRPGDLSWDDLPPRCIVQMHWRPRPDVLNLCRDFGFRPVLVVRHPLDVLISILHFCSFEPATRQWLNSEAGNEDSIYRKHPADPAFAAYASSARAAALLSVSAEWMQHGIPYVRFEDLVDATETELAAFLRQLPAKPVCRLAGVVEAHTLQKSRTTARNQHFWRGQPGIWKELIGRDLAGRIQVAHANVFISLGYGIEGASNRTPEEILSFWNSVAASGTSVAAYGDGP